MRLVLTIEAGALRGREFVLPGGSLTLGREEGCGLRFHASEAQVSRRHAVIRADPCGFRFTDERARTAPTSTTSPSLWNVVAGLAGSWPRRMGWLASALGDPRRLGARRHFLHAATRLALSYGHAERAALAGGETLSAGLIPDLRAEVAGLRTAV